MDKQCRYCKRGLPEGGEFTLTMLGVVAEQCLICALVRNNVIEDYWGGLSAETRAEVQKIKTQYFPQ